MAKHAARLYLKFIPTWLWPDVIKGLKLGLRSLSERFFDKGGKINSSYFPNAFSGRSPSFYRSLAILKKCAVLSQLKLSLHRYAKAVHYLQY